MLQIFIDKNLYVIGDLINNVYVFGDCVDIRDNFLFCIVQVIFKQGFCLYRFIFDYIFD